MKLYRVKYENWNPYYYVAASDVSELSDIGYHNLPCKPESGDCVVISADVIDKSIFMGEVSDEHNQGA